MITVAIALLIVVISNIFIFEKHRRWMNEMQKEIDALKKVKK